VTHIDLFSGIGGFALAARWAGIKTVQFVEIDPFCQRILQKNFKEVPIHDDIKTFKWSGASPFILTGGVPCQPASCAGKRKGKTDDRWLWGETFEVIAEVKPTWCILENVRGLLTLEQGVAFDKLLSGLEAIDYETRTFIIPACAVNAPHRRDRVWIVANNNRSGYGAPASRADSNGQALGKEQEQPQSEYSGQDSSLTNTNTGGIRRHQRESVAERATPCSGEQWSESWLKVATSLCRVDDGVPKRVDRINRLKALGNSIVPQVAFEIMKVIKTIKLQGEEV